MDFIPNIPSIFIEIVIIHEEKKINMDYFLFTTLKFLNILDPPNSFHEPMSVCGIEFKSLLIFFILLNFNKIITRKYY